MEKKSWVPFCILCLTFLQIIEIQAQKIEKTIKFTWTDNIVDPFHEDNPIEFLHFDGATYLSTYGSLPCFYEKFAVDNFYSDYDISVSDIVYEGMSTHDCSLIPEGIVHSTLSFDAYSAYEGENTFALISFVPIIQAGKGTFQRVTSITFHIQGRSPNHRAAKSGHPVKSVLSTGRWYNFTVQRTGIYKVTYDDLLSMGMSTPIHSSQLALFGNGGKMIAESSSASDIQGLQELPIQIYDGEDGEFNSGDYFIFYGESPHSIFYDTIRNAITHITNIYSDKTTYFITNSPGIGVKKRISITHGESLTANKTISEYTHFDFLENDIYNLSETGREWFGDLFDITTQYAYAFDVPGFKQGMGRLTLSVASASSSYSNMQVKANQNSVGTMNLPSIAPSIMANIAQNDFYFNNDASRVNISLTFSKPTTTSSAYLNWIEIEVPCHLSMHSAQFPFCNPSTVGTGNVTQFNIGHADGNTRVWDVTDPANCTQQYLSGNNGNLYFKTPTDELRFFYAFDGSEYLSITPGEAVANQDLFSTGAVDMVIVTHPDFLSQAKRLASFRQSNDGLSVKVVTTQQVYNDFSSGSLDPMAIRDYMRLIYDKTNHQYPKYLLLVGRPSYDYRGRVNGTSIFVPGYEHPTKSNKVAEIDFYANDDAFALLDDGECESGTGLYDIAVGRIPASTIAQATAGVDKSIAYTEKRNLVGESSSVISNFSDWRNIVAFVADDEEFNDFVSNADFFSQIIENSNPNINFDKIYLDAYQQVSNAGGQRYPEVTSAINNRMNRGSLFMTYIGHSGKDGWAAERILENSDINKWTNKYNLPAMLTLSCTFGYYDRPAVSPAELAYFNNNGGTIALITTTREAWSGPNNSFGSTFFSKMFEKEDGHFHTIGDLERITKNSKGGASTSVKMFVLLGDPSIHLAVPTYKIVTDSINHHATHDMQDTLRALSKVTISGRILDHDDQLLSDFNGSIYPSVFDKKVKTSTLGNDPNSMPFEFDVQKSILFKGNCSVKNGRFSFSFYVPKDIDYNFGNGKISYYACSSNQDGAGAFTDFIIGGTDTNGLEDKEGPTIELFLNDENFVNGGVVGPNSTLIAKIKDNYGINTTGNGIGHDITAVIDNATESQIVLNDYYQTEKDSFNMGTVRYSLDELTPGIHTISLRAWDINNNHSESEVTFEVVSDEKLELSHVLNYPNPFTTHTDFYFEQNQNGGIFDILIQIYTISGKLLKTIRTSQYIEGNRCEGISWDGLDDYGDKIGKGVYMYKVLVRDQNNQVAEKIEKLVIL